MCVCVCVWDILKIVSVCRYIENIDCNSLLKRTLQYKMDILQTKNPPKEGRAIKTQKDRS